MKNIFILLICSTIGFQACDKDGPGDSYDLSNPIAPYVALSSTADIEVVQGDDAKVIFSVRTAFQQKVTIYYHVTGAIDLADQSVTLERNKTSVSVFIPTPGDIITTPGTTEEAVVTLTKATTESGKDLTIGQLNNPEMQHVSIVIADQ
ncbi:MAG: hypothetical protein ABI687_12680 [Flavitalea sp.]